MLPAEPKKLSSPKSTDAAPGQHHTPLPPGLSPDGGYDQAAVMPAALSASPSLGTLLHAFRRSWVLAVPLAVGGALAAAALTWLLLPAQYTTSIVFRIQSRPQQSSLEQEDNFVAIQKSQVALLKSYDVLAEGIEKSRVAELYGVQTNPREVGKKMRADFVEGPEILHVSLSGPNPEAVAALLNALGEVYPGKTNKTEEARIKQHIAQLERRLSIDQDRGDAGRMPTLAEQLRDKRVELRQAEIDAKLDDASDLRAKLNNARMAVVDAQRTLSAKRTDIEGAKAQLESKKERLAKVAYPAVSDLEVEETLRNDPDYQEVLRDISKVKKEIDETKARAKRSFWAKLLVEPRKRIALLEETRREMLDSSRGKAQARADALTRAKLKEEVNDLEDRLKQMDKQEKSLRAELSAFMKKVEELEAGGPKAPPHVMALRDQVHQLENEYKRVGEQLAALKGGLPVQPRVVRYAEAPVPTEKDLNRVVKFSLGSAGLVFFSLLGGICLLEARGRRIYTSHEVATGLGLPIVGTLPRMPRSARDNPAAALTGLDPQFGMIEAVDAIRTVLLHSPRVDGARVVMIASANEGEGKTTLASHLASSLARAWRKTLLIDGDLRNPNQHNRFEQPLEPGLCEALRGEVEFDDAIKPTAVSRLWLLSAGRVDAHALQALAQDGIGGVFDWLKEQYDFIVIDSSPVLPVPDALMLGKQADAVLLSLMKDVSRMPAVYQAQQRFESLHIRVLGTVVIGEKTERYGYPVPYGPKGAN